MPGKKPPARALLPLPPVHPFDRRLGTDTGGLIPRKELVTGHPNDLHITAYYGVAPSILNALVDLWLGTRPAAPIDRTTFLDVGAGKGRALITAAMHPFRACVGIELNPVMAEIARSNIERVEAQPDAGLLAPLELVKGDALEAPLPEGPVLAFMFHPFERPVLKRFIARAAQRYAGGSFDLLYVNAEHVALLDRHEGFTRLFHGLIPMSAEDHAADLEEIAQQKEYGSTGDEICSIFRLTGESSAGDEPTARAGAAS